MSAARAALGFLLGLSALVAAQAQDGPAAADVAPVVKRVGSVTISVDPRHGHPGGLFVVRLTSTGRLGAANAILDSRRLPFLPSRRGARALVPVGVLSAPGPATLGIEIFARRGRQRIPVELTIAPYAYAPRSVLLPETRRSLPSRPEAARDGRRLLGALRSLSSEPLAAERLLAPVASGPGDGFGGMQTWLGLETPGLRLEQAFDSVAGEYHHGLDYDVPAGTPVRAPGAGRIVLAAPLTLSGWTVVIDHGEAVASVLAHLGVVDVAEGRLVQAGEAIGRSGSTGLAAFPHVHWGVYVHAIPVDPHVFLGGLSE